MGSPSSRSEQATTTTLATTTTTTSATDSAFLQLNNLDIQGDDAASQGPSGYVYFHLPPQFLDLIKVSSFLFSDLGFRSVAMAALMILALSMSFFFIGIDLRCVTTMVCMVCGSYFLHRNLFRLLSPVKVVKNIFCISSGKKKKSRQRATGPDKTGRGLRQFSMKGSSN